MDVSASHNHPGFPSTSVPLPAGTSQFKLQFLIFVPTSEFLRQLRVSAGTQNLFAPSGPPADPAGVNFSSNRLERFLPATWWQNLVVPPRCHRAFPSPNSLIRGGRSAHSA